MSVEVNDNRDEMLPGVEPDNMVAIARGFPNWRGLKVPVGISARPSGNGWGVSFKTLPAAEVCTAASANNLNIPETGLPLVWLVDPETVRTFLASLVEAFRDDLNKAADDFEIVAVQGRTVTCTRKQGWRNSFHKLLPQLIGTHGPCEDFWLDDSRQLVARLKTREQMRIEEACRVFEDATFTEKGIHYSYTPGTFADALLDAQEGLPKTETEAPKPAKTAVLKGASLDVWRIMEEKQRLPVDKLVALAVKKKPVPDKGKDRRAEYARTAINSLVEQGALSLSDDQTEVFI